MNSVITFLSQMTLLRWITILLRSQTLILTVQLFWIYLFLLILVLFLQWLSSIGKFWSCCCFNFHWLSIILTTGCPISSHWLWLSHADWDGLHDHLRDVPWVHIFKLSTSAAASEFCGWVKVGTDVYIPHRKYQVKPHSSLVLNCLCCCHSSLKSLFSFVPKV